MKIRIIKKEVVEEISISAGVVGYGAPMTVNKDEKNTNEDKLPGKVHAKARFLQDEEGYDKDQAYAIAANMDEEGQLEEMYSTSAAMMGAGSGEIPKERNPEAHKRYVRIRFTQQGLQNFKPSPYFRDYEQQLGEKKDKKGASASYCRSTPCKKMGFTQKASCKSQGIKDCYRGKKKN